MKYRTGYVTNSSSATFVINKKDITKEQLMGIYNHCYVILNNDKKSLYYDEYLGKYDAWQINENDTIIECSTGMTNFDLFAYVVNELKIPESKIIRLKENY